MEPHNIKEKRYGNVKKKSIWEYLTIHIKNCTMHGWDQDEMTERKISNKENNENSDKGMRRWYNNMYVYCILWFIPTHVYLTTYS